MLHRDLRMNVDRLNSSMRRQSLVNKEKRPHYIWQPTGHIGLNGEKWKVESLSSKIWDETLPLLVFHIVLEVLVRVIRQEKKSKGHSNWKGRSHISLIHRRHDLKYRKNLKNSTKKLLKRIINSVNVYDKNQRIKISSIYNWSFLSNWKKIFLPSIIHFRYIVMQKYFIF